MSKCEQKLEEFLLDSTIYHNDVGAEGYGFRHGWKAALEWIQRQIAYQEPANTLINEELEYEGI